MVPPQIVRPDLEGGFPEHIAIIMDGNGRWARRRNLPRVMGHRGTAARAPENTLAGIRAAKDSGLDWVEFDTMLTGDGVPVLYHDDNLQRTTGRDALMENTAFADLASLEAGAWFDHRFHGEPVPSL